MSGGPFIIFSGGKADCGWPQAESEPKWPPGPSANYRRRVSEMLRAQLLSRLTNGRDVASAEIPSDKCSGRPVTFFIHSTLCGGFQRDLRLVTAGSKRKDAPDERYRYGQLDS